MCVIIFQTRRCPSFSVRVFREVARETLPEWHLLRIGSEGASNPLSGLQGPLAVGTPRPSVDLADQTAPLLPLLPVYSDVATLGSLKPHKGVGFQPNEALGYRGSRQTTQTTKDIRTRTFDNASAHAAAEQQFVRASAGQSPPRYPQADAA